MLLLARVLRPEEASDCRCGSLPCEESAWLLLSVESTSFRGLARERLSGSRVMVRGFGGYRGEISIRSTKYTFRSQVIVGDIVVGRVSVAVIMYVIVPRSNYNAVLAVHTDCACRGYTYVDAAWQVGVWELELKVELVFAFSKPAISA